MGSRARASTAATLFRVVASDGPLAGRAVVVDGVATPRAREPLATPRARRS